MTLTYSWFRGECVQLQVIESPINGLDNSVLTCLMYEEIWRKAVSTLNTPCYTISVFTFTIFITWASIPTYPCCLTLVRWLLHHQEVCPRSGQKLMCRSKRSSLLCLLILKEKSSSAVFVLLFIGPLPLVTQISITHQAKWEEDDWFKSIMIQPQTWAN